MDQRARNTVIRHDCSDDEYDDFRDHVESLAAEELAAIADRLGLSQQSTWQDYADSFENESWDDFIEAYEHVTSRTY